MGKQLELKNCVVENGWNSGTMQCSGLSVIWVGGELAGFTFGCVCEGVSREDQMMRIFPSGWMVSSPP